MSTDGVDICILWPQISIFFEVLLLSILCPIYLREFTKLRRLTSILHDKLFCLYNVTLVATNEHFTCTVQSFCDHKLVFSVCNLCIFCTIPWSPKDESFLNIFTLKSKNISFSFWVYDYLFSINWGLKMWNTRIIIEKNKHMFSELNQNTISMFYISLLFLIVCWVVFECQSVDTEVLGNNTKSTAILQCWGTYSVQLLLYKCLAWFRHSNLLTN